MFPAFLTTLCWSLSAICGGRSARLIGGVEANFWRLGVATVMLTLWAFLGGKGLAGGAVTTYLLSGLFGIGLGDAAYFQALTKLGPRLSVMVVQCLSVPFGALIEWLWLGTRLSWTQVFFSLVILAGISVSLAPGKGFHVGKRAWETGILFGAIGAFGNALGAVLSRRASAITALNGIHLDGGTAAFQRIFGGLLVSGSILLILRWRDRGKPPRDEENHPVSQRTALGHRRRLALPWISTNALFGMTLGVTCFQWALSEAPTGVVLSIVATTPLVTIPLAYFIDREHPSRRSILGGFVAVAGVVGLSLVK